MKRILFVILLLGSWFMAPMLRADFYVEVTRSGKQHYYAAEETGAVDFQGRTQFKAECVALQNGDVLKCYDGENKVSWVITANDKGDTWGADGFEATADGLKCSATGNFDVYIKLKYEDDVWYIEGPQKGCTPAKEVDPGQGGGGGGGDYTTAAPAKCPDVMLQGFYWNSNTNNGFGRTKWIDMKRDGVAAEMGQWFDLVWFPPSAKSSGGLGYHPRQYSCQDSDLGTKGNLVAVIDTLHQNGCRVVADIVVNHCDGSSWCAFEALDFGEYGKFQPKASWICKTDEVNFDPNAGSCKGKATGGNDDGYDGEANYAASRDWDHGQAEVRDMIKAYLMYLRYTIGYDGFRYDYCKGFHMSHVDDYNKTAKPYFSVLEYWDGNPSTLQSRLNDAGWNTLTFDFANYYTALKGGIAVGDYGKCKGAGLPGQGKARYACTFVDSHDTFQRGMDMGGDVAGYGSGESVTMAKDKVLACNAYILSMPGVPCVFWPHWVTFKSDIKAMINARYKTGVHSESGVSDEAGNGYYKATITGTNGEIRLLLGPNSGYGQTPAGYTKAASGTNWGVYYKLVSPREDKNKNREPIVPEPTGVENVETVPAAPVAEKVMVDGKLYLRTIDGVFYDLMGRRL